MFKYTVHSLWLPNIIAWVGHDTNVVLTSSHCQQLADIFSGVMSTRSNAVRTILKLFLWALALALFALQVHDVVKKYRDKKTTMTVTKEMKSTIQPPLLTFHTDESFNKVRAKLFSAGNVIEIFTDEKNLHLNNDDVYRNISYVIGRDFTMSIIFVLQTGILKTFNLEIGENIAKLNESVSVIVWLHETYTLFNGLSYSVDVRQNMGLSSGLFFLTFNFSDTSLLPIEERPKQLNMYLSDPEERYGVFFDYWVGVTPYSFSVDMGHSATLYWEKSIHIINEDTDSVCNNYADDDSVIRCSYQLMAEDLRRKFLKSCDKMCAIAPFRTLMELSTDGKDLNFCKTKQEISCLGNINTVVEFTLACAKPCEQNSYGGRLLSKNVYEGDGIIVLQFMLNSAEVSTHEEVLLFDFVTFIGSFGGSLGLFVGFSFLDFTTLITDKIVQYLCPKVNN